jgi:hypothetical protein
MVTKNSSAEYNIYVHLLTKIRLYDRSGSNQSSHEMRHDYVIYTNLNHV